MTRITAASAILNELVVVLAAIAWLVVPVAYQGGASTHAKGITVNFIAGRTVEA